MIKIENITYKINQATILNNINLTIPNGGITALIGANGAGKSTTLKMITGMLHKTSGEILFEDKPWSRADLEKIGALIEMPPLYDNLTAWENLKVRTLLLGLPDSRIKEVLEIVDLKNTGKKKSGQFSIGMKQRLGIAIALLNHPRLLILDEPTNGLDPLGIQELRDLIKSFPEQGITVILSSHILAEVEQIADHIGIIDNGRLEYQNAINHQENLEELFMNVVKKGRRENEHAL